MTASIALPRPRPARRIEPLYITLLKAALYAAAITLYLRPLSSLPGIVSAICCALAALFLADMAHRKRLRLAVVLTMAPVILLGALLGGERLLDSTTVARALGIDNSFAAADAVTFGLLGLATVFTLRALSNRARLFSLLEVVFVAGSVATMLADHRNRMLNRPRFFSDWAWTLGIDPSTVLVGIGAAVSLVAALLFLRDQPLLKVVSSLLLLLLLGFLFYSLSDKKIDAKGASDALGLSGKGRSDNDNKKKGKGGGGGDNPFKDNYQSTGPPQPVAIAILRDELEARDGVVYFRQRVLSKYNGVHLTASDDHDHDVISKLPQKGVARATPTQVAEHHTVLPTTMYLLVDHPQPPALTHAQRIELVENPNPRQFVAAYEVRSQVLAVDPRRLLGRRSIPESWSAERAKYYTELPDDPRYRTLADIIVRKLDPRYAHDDLAKAFAIKRYLEKQGFYTRKSTHASKSDPTASFLFGNMRGYCVHFAHAAVYLFRSQGIASRVALGYAVQMRKRAGGSSLLIMGDRAHAWPEIYLDGIGWVTFDIYPEHTDMPPPSPVDYDLERLLGELARDDPTGGRSPSGKPLVIPWGPIAYAGSAGLAALLLLAYLIKLTRALAPRVAPRRGYCRWAYIAALDRLSDLGQYRQRGETREAHAARLTGLAPSLRSLTAAHLARAFGSRRATSPQEFRGLVEALRHDLRSNVHPLRRLLGVLNPISWLRTR